MTNAPSDSVPLITALAPDPGEVDEETRHAWVGRMAVHPFGDGQYVVQEGDRVGHVVDLHRGECTCPTYDETGESCRHLRRVAIEINLGRLTVDRPAECRACGERTGSDPETDPPVLCGSCRLDPGDVVVDREGRSGSPLLVLSVTERRADEVTVPGTDRTVAEYGPNRRYPASDPLVEVVYPHSVRADRPPRRYSFPISRVERPGGRPGGVQTTIDEFTRGE